MRNERKGWLSQLMWDLVASATGAPQPRSVCIARGTEEERACWDPKDGELYVIRSKPEETLVEDRRDSDVQIDLQNCVWERKTNRAI